MNAATARPARPLLGRGLVRHQRLRPVVHGFEYPSQFLMLPMRALRDRPEPALARNGRAALSFHDRDHGDGGADALDWIERLLAGQGVAGADGEIWLQTFPRVFGRVFKPVSFWYCERADGTLAAVVAEVNNTFGERHCYLLDGAALAWGRDAAARKVFHVSPFCTTAGQYRFRFLRTPDRLVARVDHDDAEGPLLQTSLSGRLQPLTAGSVRRAVAAMPFAGLSVWLRIHGHALALWWRGLPLHARPAPPVSGVSR